MAEFFNKNNIKAVALHSDSDPVGDRVRKLSRKEIVEQFRHGDIPILFVVDIFNEGVDIPEIDTVMFLRPTESYVIFLQQLGRGLRRDSSKKYLTVIDFIGNYKKAHYKPMLLSGVNPMAGREPVSRKHNQIDYPEGCSVQFDMRIIDMFEEMARHDPLKLRMRDEFLRLSDEMESRPMRCDVMMGSDIAVGEFMKPSFLAFLNTMGVLDSEELGWIGTLVETFLMRMEKTSMTRSYKLPVLTALLENGGSVGYDALGVAFRDFYMNSRRRCIDLQKNINSKNESIEAWEIKDFLSIALKNPVHFLAKTEFEFIKNDEVGKRVYFADGILDAWNGALAAHLRDIIKVRENQYYSRKYLVEIV